MKHASLMRWSVLALLACSLLPGADAPPGTASWAGWRGKARHLLIVVIDGPRWTETWADPLIATQNIPHMANELARLGTRYTAFRNTGWTYTNCGHTALTTGYYEQIENQGNELPSHPSVFQLFRAATDHPAESTWVIASKDKLHILADTKDTAWKGRLVPRFDCGKPGGGYRDDVDTTAVVERTLTTDHPELMLVNLREPDSYGHAKDWKGYLRGIQTDDAAVARIWAAIQADPELKDRTDLFVTNDHGRHLDGHDVGFISHGDDCEGCRQISLLALGPDIAPGVVQTQTRNQIDLAATVAWLAGIDLPGSPGVVMHELVGQGQ